MKKTVILLSGGLDSATTLYFAKKLGFKLTALIFSFLLIPVVLSIFGFSKLPFKSKNIIYFGSIFSVFLLGFLMNSYFLRHVFLLFPIIYPTAVLGMERKIPSPIFQAIIIGIIILISNINIYQIFNYNDFHP